jgi:hypothetical protein
VLGVSPLFVLSRIFKTEQICRQGSTLISLENGENNQLPQLEAPTPATPIPPENEQTHDANAWDPNSSVPISNPAVPYWLADEVFRGIRVKLRYCTQPSPPFLEFCGMEEESVKVRDGTRRVLVPLSTLQAIPPNWQGDIVTSFALGETYGRLYKIREFRSDFCVLRGYGEKTGRKEKNFTILTHELATVFPPMY